MNKARAWLIHEWELLNTAVDHHPQLRKQYKKTLHYGHVAYWWLVGIFAHGPYGWLALGMAIVLIANPILGGDE